MYRNARIYRNAQKNKRAWTWPEGALVSSLLDFLYLRLPADATKDSRSKGIGCCCDRYLRVAAAGTRAQEPLPRTGIRISCASISSKDSRFLVISVATKSANPYLRKFNGVDDVWTVQTSTSTSARATSIIRPL